MEIVPCQELTALPMLLVNPPTEFPYARMLPELEQKQKEATTHWKR